MLRVRALLKGTVLSGGLRRLAGARAAGGEARAAVRSGELLVLGARSFFARSYCTSQQRVWTCPRCVDRRVMLALLVVGEKAELAGSKTLAITLGRRSVVHAARIQRPSCSICPRARCGGDSATTGRVLQSFEQTPQRASLSQPAIIRGKRVAPRRRHKAVRCHRHAIAETH